MGEQTDSPANTITISKDTMYGATIAVLACMLVISIFTQGFYQGFGHLKAPLSGAEQLQLTGTDQPPEQQPANQTAQPASATRLQLPTVLADAPMEGSSTSGITILEFSDFQCSACGIAFGSPWAQQYYPTVAGMIPRLETSYVQTGKADFINIPVAFIGVQSGDNASINAADAALCAKDQGKYFEMYRAIFGVQSGQENGQYTIPVLEAMAQGINGLNTKAFNSCLEAGTYINQVSAFTSDWETMSYANSGGAGTPTIYVLVDASKTTQDKVSAAADSAGYTWGMTSDKKTYIIIANLEYAKIQQVLSALA